MSVRDPGSLSRANGAYLVVDHLLRGWRLMKKIKKEEAHLCLFLATGALFLAIGAIAFLDRVDAPAQLLQS